MNLRRTIITAGAVPLLAGIAILVWVGASNRESLLSLLRAGTIYSAVGFALAGLGLLSLTRQRDQKRLLTRSTALLLGVLACSGAAIVGLQALTWTNPAAFMPGGTRTGQFGSDFDLVLSIGFLGTAISLGALTLVARKRAGAAIAASLAFSVAIIGWSALVGALLDLHGDEAEVLDFLLPAILFPVIATGLSFAAKRELENGSSRIAGESGHLLCAVTGTCFGLICLCAFLCFSLVARETEEFKHTRESNRLRRTLSDARAALQGAAEGISRINWSDALPLDDSMDRVTSDLREVLQDLNRFMTYPEYQQTLAGIVDQIRFTLTNLRSAQQFQREGQSSAATQALAVLQIAHGSGNVFAEISNRENELEIVGSAQENRAALRRRGTALALFGSALCVGVLLGAIHLLFQRMTMAGHRSEAALRRNNETLKSFAHSVAHDLRAPLRGIAGYASELDGQAHSVDARGRHCITQINTAAQNLERLIGDTLDYSQLDAETPILTTITLPTLVASLLQQRAPEIRQHGTQVDTHFGIVTVTSWERGLVQILGNLLDNAIKYSRHAHPPRLRIETAQTPLSWRLVIYDNGVGFDMKYHDRIFGLFQRLVTTDEFEGTGAGLAIVRKITDRLGGTVCAEGRPGGGATFLVELPRVVSSELA